MDGSALDFATTQELIARLGLPYREQSHEQGGQYHELNRKTHNAKQRNRFPQHRIEYGPVAQRHNQAEEEQGR